MDMQGVLNNPELLKTLKEEYGIEPVSVSAVDSKFEKPEISELPVLQISELQKREFSKPKYFVPKKIGKPDSRYPRWKRR